MKNGNHIGVEFGFCKIFSKLYYTEIGMFVRMSTYFTKKLIHIIGIML